MGCRDLILPATKGEPSSPAATAGVLANEVMEGRCVLVNWNHDTDQWIARLNCLAHWYPELELPRIDADARRYLITQICYGATSYREVKERPVWPILRTWLSGPHQQALEQLAPDRHELPNGRRAKLVYAEGHPPVLAARIQDLYGVRSALTICAGRVPISIHVLAPNHRPIQVTQNLSTFWAETYPQVKPDLQRRYPKHEWQ